MAVLMVVYGFILYATDFGGAFICAEVTVRLPDCAE